MSLLTKAPKIRTAQVLHRQNKKNRLLCYKRCQQPFTFYVRDYLAELYFLNPCKSEKAKKKVGGFLEMLYLILKSKCNVNYDV